MIRCSMIMSVLVGYLMLPTEALVTPDFTREQEFRTRNGAFVVQSNSADMFTVSLGNTTIQITPSNSSFDPCTMPIDPFEDTIQGQVRVKIFPDTNVKMIIWGLRGSEITNGTTIGTAYYTLMLIDLETCRSVSVWLPDDERPISQPPLLPEVTLAHNYNGFDVHYASQWICSPCSFDRDGTRLGRDRGPLEAEVTRPAKSLQLQPLYPVEGKVGYFYAFTFVNGSSVVKLLDEYYQVRRLKYLENNVDVLSIKSGRIRTVGYCHSPPSDSSNEVHCERLDSRMQSVVSIRQVLEQAVRQMSLEYDEQGNFFVAVAQSSKLHVFVYNIVGRLITSLDFGQLQEDQRLRDLTAYFVDKQYCLFYSVEIQNYLARSKALDANNVVKCIDTRNYI